METTINLYLMLIINLFDIYIVYRLMTIFFDNHKIDNKLTIIAYLFRWLIGTVLNEFFPYPIITITFWFVSSFLICLCYKSKLSKKLVVTLSIYLLGFISEIILAIVIQLTNFNLFEKADYGNIIIYVIIKIIYWIISFILQQLKGVKLNIKLPTIFIVAVIIVPISSIIIELIILSQQNFNRQLTLISLFCLLASTFITIYLYDSYSKIFHERAQAELSKREKGYYKKQSELLQKNQEELRQFRHDIKNRIITMQQMIENKQYENALEYTNEFTERLENVIYYSETGNIAIDSIINYKLTSAVKKGITVTTDISIPEQLHVHDDDIVVIIGNMLDNAMEATDRITENKYIDFKMKYITGCLHIMTKNSYDSIVYDYNGKFKSRKGDEVMHGIGLKSIQASADNYNGSLNIDYTETEFVVHVMLYASK